MRAIKMKSFPLLIIFYLNGNSKHVEFSYHHVHILEASVKYASCFYMLIK